MTPNRLGLLALTLCLGISGCTSVVNASREAPIDDDAVVERVSAVLRREPKTAVLVNADQAVPYGRVVAGMVLLQQAGAEKVGFITSPADAKRAQQKGQ